MGVTLRNFQEEMSVGVYFLHICIFEGRIFIKNLFQFIHLFFLDFENVLRQLFVKIPRCFSLSRARKIFLGIHDVNFEKHYFLGATEA